MNILNDPELLTSYLPPIACVLFIAASVVALLRVHFALRGKPADAALAAGRAIEGRIASLGTLMEDMLTRQSEMTAQMAQLQQKIDAIGRTERIVVEPATRTSAMEHAARLARDGASVDELTRSCGLNVGEASLLRRLHGHETAARVS
jgi:Protein of unknown function (DUF2802)